MNVIELHVIMVLFSLSVVLGKYSYKSVGWLAFVPAGFFAVIFVSLLVSIMRQIFRDITTKRRQP